jgi:hypothetical protein
MTSKRLLRRHESFITLLYPMYIWSSYSRCTCVPARRRQISETEGRVVGGHDTPFVVAGGRQAGYGWFQRALKRAY